MLQNCDLICFAWLTSNHNFCQKQVTKSTSILITKYYRILNSFTARTCTSEMHHLISICQCIIVQTRTRETMPQRPRFQLDTSDSGTAERSRV